MDTRYNLNRLAYFVATIEEGSITAAAERLRISKAVVSKQLQLLEQDCGTTLLYRNTRHMHPTDAGRNLYEAGRDALIRAEQAFEAVLDRDRVPKGRLRITAPVDYGLTHVAPFIARYSNKYPEVEFDLSLADERMDLIENRVDLAFRVGWLKDSSYKARKLTTFEEIVVCTPETFARHSVQTPEALAELPFVASRAIGEMRVWRFTRGDQVREVPLQGSTVMNITLAIRMAIRAGSSFAIVPDILVEEDLASGQLVRLVPDWSLRTGGVYTVTAPGHVRSNALRTFLDMAHKELSG